MVQTELMQNCRVEVVHVDFVLDGMMPELVGRTVGESGFHATTGQPRCEAARIVVSTGPVLFGVGRPTEFATPPDDRVVEQAALFEISQQARDRQIDRLRVIGVLRHVAVLVPSGVGRVIAVVHLDVSHPRLCESASHQALATEVVGRLVTDAVQRLCLFGFLRQIKDRRSMILHPKTKLE